MIHLKEFKLKLNESYKMATHSEYKKIINSEPCIFTNKEVDMIREVLSNLNVNVYRFNGSNSFEIDVFITSKSPKWIHKKAESHYGEMYGVENSISNIRKYYDEWFIVSIRMPKHTITEFACDQMEGVLECLKNELK